MSHWAMGWAQRQKIGDPVAKAVLCHMCFLMRDDTLLVWVGLPTLVRDTEFDERTIRKAIQRLASAEVGALLDTGLKRNNVTVWRIPGYEAWLRRQNESPDKNAGASDVDARALAQVAELTKEKTLKPSSHPQPLQKGEGQGKAPSNLPSGPPISAPQAPPNVSPNLGIDPLKPSEDARARATPSGSRAAGTVKPSDVPRGTTGIEPSGYDEIISRSKWYSRLATQVLADCRLFEICPKSETLKDLPAEVNGFKFRAVISEALQELSGRAVDWEMQAPPIPFANIDADLQREVNNLLRPFRPAAAAHRRVAA